MTPVETSTCATLSGDVRLADIDDSPTIGALVALSPEEVIITPRRLNGDASVDVRVHFPRLGFVVRPVDQSKL